MTAEAAQGEGFGILGESALAPWLARFGGEVARLADNTERPLSSAWAQSVQSWRMDDGVFLSRLSDFCSENPGVTPSEGLRRFLSAEQATIIAARGADSGTQVQPLQDYPSEAYTRPEAWQNAFAHIQESPLKERYEGYLRRDLATSVSQRTVAVRFLTRALSHLIGDGARRVSCGAGDLTGDKRNFVSSQQEDLRFDPVQVRAHSRTGGLETSGYRSRLFGEIVRAPDPVGSVLCLDKADPFDKSNQTWSLACAMPEELASRKWIDLHQKLLEADVPPGQLEFAQIDLTDRSAVERLVKNNGRFDVVSALFSWYQGSREQRQKKFSNMMEVILRKGGIGIIGDFAEMTPDRTRIQPDLIWNRPKVFVYSGGELHHVMTFANGRFRDVIVHPDLGKLARRGSYGLAVNELIDRPSTDIFQL